MSIFVSIASYSDPACLITVKDCFTKASNMKDIFIGICQQNKAGDDDCFSDKWKNNIRIMRISTTEARGPTLARYYCSQLYKGEKYFLQIDSHTKFSQDWDIRFINMYKKLKEYCPKPVISYYPNGWDEHSSNVKEVGRLCHAVWDNNRSMVSLPGSTLLTPATNPTLSAFATGNCLFLEGSFLNEVPFDPNLPDLFTGEEILFSARLWTHGWDIYNPNENLVWHLYGRDNKPKFWDDWRGKRSDTDALKKVRYLLGLDDINKVPQKLRKNINKYGMGTDRTINEFWNFIGFDPTTKKFSKNFCNPKSVTEFFQMLDKREYPRLFIFIVIVMIILVCIYCNKHNK